MKTKPFIVVFPVDVDKDEVDNINGNTYTQPELDKELSIIEKQFGVTIDTFGLDNFVHAVNEQNIDVLTESWIAHVNVIEE